MNSAQEVKDFINNIDCGEAIFDVVSGWHSTEVILRQQEWSARKELTNSKHWLKRSIAVNLRRKFDKEQNKMVINFDNVYSNAVRCLHYAVEELSQACSPADQPRRTKAYKEFYTIAQENIANDAFIDDVLPIVNYYYESKRTDSSNMDTHKKNVFALFEFLRKKYGSKSSS